MRCCLFEDIIGAIAEFIGAVIFGDKEPIKMTRKWEPYVYGLVFGVILFCLAEGISLLIRINYAAGLILIVSAVVVFIIWLFVYRLIHKK